MSDDSQHTTGASHAHLYCNNKTVLMTNVAGRAGGEGMAQCIIFLGAHLVFRINGFSLEKAVLYPKFTILAH